MEAHDPTVPKTLLPIAGRPFADWQLDWLAASGVHSVVYSIGHKGHLIRDFVGDGQKWNLSVTYVEETGPLLGTGGAVRLAVDEGSLNPQFLVLYGDSYLQISMADFCRSFLSRRLPAMMAVFKNDGRWGSSNAVFDGRLVTDYRKGLADPPTEMRYIDYGLLALDRQTITESIPSGQPYDLAGILTPLSHLGMLAGFETTRRFFEIGSPAGFRELEAHFARSSKVGCQRR
jgi:NDP-sugar pyrophosphorylase family protein